MATKAKTPAKKAAKSPAMVTRLTYAKSRGLSSGRISQLIADGLPVAKDGRLDPGAADKWIAQNIAPPTGPADSAAMRDARTGAMSSFADVRRAKASVDTRLAVLELRKREGELVEKAVVERTVFERARMERDSWLGWIQRASPELAGLLDADPAETFAVLDRLVREHLSELAETPLPS